MSPNVTNEQIMESECMQYYLVGGAVRDWLLGLQPREFDMLFDGAVDTFLQMNPRARKVGRTVQVWLLDGYEYSPLKGSTLMADLAARDLTINALALEANGRVHAHPLAFHDLRHGVLRACSSASFSDDPCRVFRVARLACQFPSFCVHPETLELMREAASLLSTLPAERVCRECRKALRSPRPSRWLAVLHAADCLEPWFGELAGAARVPAGPATFHTGSVLDHLMETMDAVAGDELAVWMALCHDVGKTGTDPAVLPHHVGHDRRGVPLVDALGVRLGLPIRHRVAGAMACRLHMKAGQYTALRRATRRDLLMEVHNARLDDPFWRLVEADSGLTLRPAIHEDLVAMAQATLPPAWRDRGPASGRHLRELQCQMLPSRKNANCFVNLPDCTLDRNGGSG